MPFRFDDPKDGLFHELNKAIQAQVPEPTAMALATLGSDGFPQVRTVLYKGWRDSGLSFFTNYNSPKGQALISHPKACLNFFWASLNQQIRIQGVVHQLSREQSQEYFSSRPRLSQIGAWASDQSKKLSSYEELQKKVKAFEEKFQGVDPIPCPPYWGGFVLVPLRYEFWFAHEGRLHERYVFERTSTEDSTWDKFLLNP
jgi:pyridoxamine 5'-phosphate oxidase